MIRYLLVLCVLVGCLFFPAHKASAITWQQALSNCKADAAYLNSIGQQYVTGDCVLVASTNRWNLGWDKPDQPMPGGASCANWSYPAGVGGSCVYSGSGPPTCTKGRVDAGAALSGVDSWSDGTECDGGCMVGQFVGGSMNGDRYFTGAYCPYDASANPPDAPPPSDQAASPPACNADGSCVTCSGSLCASTGLPPPPAPPPPASGSSSGNHSTTYNNTTNNSYSSSTTFSGGAASGGSTGGVSGGMDGTTATTTGTGTTDSEGKCDSGACDVGEADGQLGGLYEHSAQTPQGMFTDFIAQVKASPVISATTGFFNVQAGGSCPSWHIPGNKYWGEAGFDFSFFCDPAFLAIFQLAGYLVLAGGAFCAFRIALY